VTFSWFFLSTLNYDARSTTHHFKSVCTLFVSVSANVCSTAGYNLPLQFIVLLILLQKCMVGGFLFGSFPSILHELRIIVVFRVGKLELKLDQVITLPK